MKTRVKIVNRDHYSNGMTGYIDGYVSFSGWQGGIAVLVVVGDKIISTELNQLKVLTSLDS